MCFISSIFHILTYHYKRKITKIMTMGSKTFSTEERQKNFGFISSIKTTEDYEVIHFTATLTDLCVRQKILFSVSRPFHSFYICQFQCNSRREKVPKNYLILFRLPEESGSKVQSTGDLMTHLASLRCEPRDLSKVPSFEVLMGKVVVYCYDCRVFRSCDREVL